MGHLEPDSDNDRSADAAECGERAIGFGDDREWHSVVRQEWNDFRATTGQADTDENFGRWWADRFQRLFEWLDGIKRERGLPS